MNAPLTDQQLQQLLEMGHPLPSGASGPDAASLAVYQRVFAALEQELPLQPAPAFSTRLLAQLEAGQPASPSRLVNGWGWLVVALLLGLLIGLWLLAPLEAATVALWNSLVAIRPFTGLLLFSLGSLLAWQILDWQLVRKPSLQHSVKQPVVGRSRSS